jgi:sulfite exporter TauE/SafE
MNLLISSQFWAAASLGFLASLHCIFMCGPLALAIPIGKLSNRNRTIARSVFVIGRWFVYVVMGALVGFIGKPISWLGFQDFWMLLLISILLFLVVFWERDYFISIRKKFQNFSRQIIENHPVSGFFVLGIANGLLPCGMVYTALAFAMLSGSFWLGAGVMLIFGMANSWWHLVLIFGWRIPKFNFPALSFLGSNRVAFAILVCTLVFRFIHNLDGHQKMESNPKKMQTEGAVCGKAG